MGEVFLRCPVMGLPVDGHYFNRAEFLSGWVGSAYSGEVVKWKFLSAGRDLWVFSFGLDGSRVLCEGIAVRIGLKGELASSLFSVDAILNWFMVADEFVAGGVLDAAWEGFVGSGGLVGVDGAVARPRSFVDLVSILSVVWRDPGELSILGFGLSVSDLVGVLCCEFVDESVCLWVWRVLGSLEVFPSGVSFGGVCSEAFGCLVRSGVWWVQSGVGGTLLRAVIAGCSDWGLLLELSSVVPGDLPVGDVSGACLSSVDPLFSVLSCGYLLMVSGGLDHLGKCLSLVLGNDGFGEVLRGLYAVELSSGGGLSLSVLKELYAVGVSFGYVC